MAIYRAGTMLIPSGPTHDPNRLHLHVVCNDTDADGNNLIVSISTYSNNLCDATCILEEHEHEWLRHQSYVFYRRARIVSAQALERGVDDHLMEPQADMNMQVFLKVKNGICRSPQTPKKIKTYIGCDQDQL